MKMPLSLYVAAAVLVLATHAQAQQSSPPAPESSPIPKTKGAPKWSFRVEGLAVVVPQEKALPMLPDLLDETKADAAVAKITEGIQHKEFTLAAYQTVLTADGETATTETISELIYPTQYEPPSDPQHLSGSAAPTSTPAGSLPAMPTAFEKRNVGIELAVQDARIAADGQRISANIHLQDVSFAGWELYEGAQTILGKMVKVQQPRFFVVKSNAVATFPNGRFVLIGLHKLEKPEGSMEVHLARITAIWREP